MGVLCLRRYGFENEGYGHTREGRNISAVLEFVDILVQAMEIATTSSDSNIQFMLNMVRALQGLVT